MELQDAQAQISTLQALVEWEGPPDRGLREELREVRAEHNRERHELVGEIAARDERIAELERQRREGITPALAPPQAFDAPMSESEVVVRGEGLPAGGIVDSRLRPRGAAAGRRSPAGRAAGGCHPSVRIGRLPSAFQRPK